VAPMRSSATWPACCVAHSMMDAASLMPCTQQRLALLRRARSSLRTVVACQQVRSAIQMVQSGGEQLRQPDSN